MNLGMIFYVLGWILNLEALLMVPSVLCGLVYRERAVLYILAAMLCCFALGIFAIIFKPKKKKIRAKEGFVITALAWLVLSIFGALPFWLSGYIPDPINAVFETASGFTTTGASILSDVEALPHCMLFWRSFTHWVGGMGVIVFLIALLPMAGGSDMFLMKAESPGPDVSKIVPKVKTTAMTLYGLYVFLTVLQICILLATGMPVFDTLCLTFGTAGTGGFAVLNSGLANYPWIQQWVITIFMIAFGVNFNFYFFVYRKRMKDALHMSEVKVYLTIILASAALITINILPMYGSIAEAVKDAAFQVGSIITTTGYSTADFNIWPGFSKTILVTLMFIGACAGSTGGGMKVSRIQILAKTIHREIQTYIHPNSVKLVKLDGKEISHPVRRGTYSYVAAYLFIFVISLLVISLDNFDFETNFTAVAATFNNIGPGLSKVGPTSNFASYSALSRIVLTFDMIAGRLEIFPVLILFSRHTWKK